MTTLDEYARRFAPDAQRHEDRIQAAYEALQHQGSRKRAAYEHMPALVELEMDEELARLWGTLGSCTHVEAGEVPASFPAALEIAAGRLIAALPTADTERSALATLIALAGVTGEPEAHDLLEELDAPRDHMRVLATLTRAVGWKSAQRVIEAHGSFDHACSRCGAAMLLTRRGAGLDHAYRDVRSRVDAPAAEPDVPGATLARGVSLLQYPELRAAIAAAFGPIPCLRCAHRERIVDRRLPRPLRPITRRAEGASGEALTLEMSTEERESILARLREFAREPTEDVLRLPGVGSIEVSHAPPSRLPKCALSIDPSLDALVDGKDVHAPLPSDAPALDAFAERILSAFQTHDVVDVPGFARLAVKTTGTRRRVWCTFAADFDALVRTR